MPERIVSPGPDGPRHPVAVVLTENEAGDLYHAWEALCTYIWELCDDIDQGETLSVLERALTKAMAPIVDRTKDRGFLRAAKKPEFLTLDGDRLRRIGRSGLMQTAEWAAEMLSDQNLDLEPLQAMIEGYADQQLKEERDAD